MTPQVCLFLYHGQAILSVKNGRIKVRQECMSQLQAEKGQGKHGLHCFANPALLDLTDRVAVRREPCLFQLRNLESRVLLQC